MTISEYTHALGEATGHGWGFLAAYGLAWLTCAILWRRAAPRTAAYASLFQGMVALPVALGLTALTPGPERPAMDGMDLLAVLLASGQLLALPVVVVLVVRRRYTFVPLAMALVVIVHFAPYAWLYATPLYLVMGAAVAVGVAVTTGRVRRGTGTESEHAVAAAGDTCLVTGAILLASAAVAWFL